MSRFIKIAHVLWHCQYHLIWVPKYRYKIKVSISDLMGALKGRSAIRMFRHYPNLKTKPYWENHFWAEGYCVDTVGVNEEMIRKYVRYQENQERKMEQQRFKF